MDRDENLFNLGISQEMLCAESTPQMKKSLGVVLGSSKSGPKVPNNGGLSQYEALPSGQISPGRSRSMMQKKYALSDAKYASYEGSKLLKSQPSFQNKSAHNTHVNVQLESLSAGFTSRIVQYSKEQQQHMQPQPHHRTAPKYDGPGVFPIVHIHKHALPLLKNVKRKPRRIAFNASIPELSQYHSASAVEDGEHAAKENGASNKSVLEALKEISRKRIHSNEEEYPPQLNETKKRQKLELINSENPKKRQREISPELKWNGLFNGEKVIDEIMASRSSMMMLDTKHEAKAVTKKKCVEPVSSKATSAPVIMVNVETQTVQAPKAEEPPKLQDEEVEEKQVVVAPPPLKVIDDKPLEMLRKQRLALLIGVSPPNQETQVKRPEETATKEATQTPLKSIVAHRITEKASTKHVTFNITEQSEGNSDVSNSFANVQTKQMTHTSDAQTTPRVSSSERKSLETIPTVESAKNASEQKRMSNTHLFTSDAQVSEIQSATSIPFFTFSRTTEQTVAVTKADATEIVKKTDAPKPVLSAVSSPSFSTTAAFSFGAKTTSVSSLQSPESGCAKAALNLSTPSASTGAFTNPSTTASTSPFMFGDTATSKTSPNASPAFSLSRNESAARSSGGNFALTSPITSTSQFSRATPEPTFKMVNSSTPIVSSSVFQTFTPAKPSESISSASLFEDQSNTAIAQGKVDGSNQKAGAFTFGPNPVNTSMNFGKAPEFSFSTTASSLSNAAPNKTVFGNADSNKNMFGTTRSESSEKPADKTQLFQFASSGITANFSAKFSPATSSESAPPKPMFGGFNAAVTTDNNTFNASNFTAKTTASATNMFGNFNTSTPSTGGGKNFFAGADANPPFGGSGNNLFGAKNQTATDFGSTGTSQNAFGTSGSVFNSSQSNAFGGFQRNASAAQSGFQSGTNSTPDGFQSSTNNPGGFQGTANNAGGFQSATNNAGGFPSTSNNAGGFQSTTNSVGGFQSSTNSAGGFQSSSNTPGAFQGATNTSGAFQSTSNNQGGFQSLSNTPGAFQSSTNPPGTFQSASNPPGTFQTNTNPSGTFQTNTNPSGTFQSASNPPGAFQTNTNPSGTFQTNTNPSGTFQTNTNPSGSFQSGTNAPGTFQNTSNTQGAFQSTSNTQGAFQGSTNTPGTFQNTSNTAGAFQTTSNTPGTFQAASNPPNRFQSNLNTIGFPTTTSSTFPSNITPNFGQNTTTPNAVFSFGSLTNTTPQKGGEVFAFGSTQPPKGEAFNFNGANVPQNTSFGAPMPAQFGSAQMGGPGAFTIGSGSTSTSRSRTQLKAKRRT